MSSNNLHRLFQPVSDGDTLIHTLTLIQEERTALIEAKDVVRAALRSGLPSLLKKALPDVKTIETPKFFTQGSFAYKTVNRPCHPGQQIDLDDGCYLPMSFAKEFEVGTASDVFFRAVETVLQPVAAARKWEMVRKETCTRLVLDSSKHIDIPLYAIPDTEFKRLQESAQVREFTAVAKAGAMDSLRPIQWDDLPHNKVLLALRSGGWRSSDPRPVLQWVKNQASTKGDQWLHVVRYMKAWRDYQWPNGGPTSICLMAAVDRVFNRGQKRDDMALLDVLTQLPVIFAGNIYNPADTSPRQEDRERLSTHLDEDPNLRNEVVQKLRAFGSDLHRAIHGRVSAQEACTLLRRHLGTRIPLRPEWVSVEGSVSSQVHSVAPKISHAAAIIPTTKSG